MSSFTVDLAPNTVLSKAVSFMTSNDFVVENQSSNSVTFDRGIRASGGSLAIDSLLTLAQPDVNWFSDTQTMLNTMNTKATLAVETMRDGKTQVVLGGAPLGVSVLESWIKNDVLKIPDPTPVLEIKGPKADLRIFNDHLVVRWGSIYWGGKGEKSTHMSEIKSVEMNRNDLVIEDYKGQSTTIVRPKYAQALAAKSIIEYRMRVHQEAPEELEEATIPSTSDVAIDIPEMIGKLAELRDKGILSSEEFETKKADLLDRM